MLSTGQEEYDVADLPLMQSSVPILLILACYLYFIYNLGPRLMRNREAFNLKKTLIIYNGSQVIFSVWQFCKFFGLNGSFNAIVHCNYTNQYYEKFLIVWWWYFISKMVELLDTVFFVLRKKQSQVTLLHVYHHCIMVMFSWAYLRYFQDAYGILICLFNTLVHIVMYSYYLISAFGPNIQKYLWWKRYITWLQLSQFIVGAMYLPYLKILGCNTPTHILTIYGLNTLIFLYLFSTFYIKAYSSVK